MKFCTLFPGENCLPSLPERCLFVFACAPHSSPLTMPKYFWGGRNLPQVIRFLPSYKQAQRGEVDRDGATYCSAGVHRVGELRVCALALG